MPDLRDEVYKFNPVPRYLIPRIREQELRNAPFRVNSVSPPPDRTASAALIYTEENTGMLTNQVRELSHDLAELIRKHQGRDLTRTEIVRQLATEGCVLIEKDEALMHIHRLLIEVVERTVDIPQTVDMKPERDSQWTEQAEARTRLIDRVTAAMDEALDRLDQHIVATTFVDQAMVALQPGDDRVPSLYRPAFAALKGARDVLCHAVDDSALDLMWDLIRSRIRAGEGVEAR